MEPTTTQAQRNGVNGFFMPEPIPVDKIAKVVRRRNREKFFRLQNAMLGYILVSPNGHPGNGRPAQEEDLA